MKCAATLVLLFGLFANRPYEIMARPQLPGVGGGSGYIVKFLSFIGEANEWADFTHIKLEKRSKDTYVYTGIVYILKTLPDDLTGSAAAYRKMGNGFVKSAVAFEDMDACEGYKKDTYLAPEITKKTKIMDLCPLKQGNYTIDDYLPDISALPPNLPTGLYRVTVEGKTQGKSLGKFTVEFDLKNAN